MHNIKIIANIVESSVILLRQEKILLSKFPARNQTASWIMHHAEIRNKTSLALKHPLLQASFLSKYFKKNNIYDWIKKKTITYIDWLINNDIVYVLGTIFRNRALRFRYPFLFTPRKSRTTLPKPSHHHPYFSKPFFSPTLLHPTPSTHPYQSSS